MVSENGNYNRNNLNLARPDRLIENNERNKMEKIAYKRPDRGDITFLSKELVDFIAEYIKDTPDYNKIELIKELSRDYDLSLIEAKEYVECALKQLTTV